MRALDVLARLALVGAANGCSDGLAPPAESTPPVAAASVGDVELVGVSGTRLRDGDSYRVPLQLERRVAVGDTVREALVVVDRGPGEIRVDALRLLGDAGEWRLLTPVQRERIDLDADGAVLAPDGRLDFDLALTPAAEGERRVVLELAWTEAGVEHREDVLFYAEATRPGTAPGPP